MTLFGNPPCVAGETSLPRPRRCAVEPDGGRAGHCAALRTVERTAHRRGPRTGSDARRWTTCSGCPRPRSTTTGSIARWQSSKNSSIRCRVHATWAITPNGVASSPLLRKSLTSDVVSSDRRTKSQTGRPAFPGRTAQTHTAANSKTSGPLAPWPTPSAPTAPAAGPVTCLKFATVPFHNQKSAFLARASPCRWRTLIINRSIAEGVTTHYNLPHSRCR